VSRCQDEVEFLGVEFVLTTTSDQKENKSRVLSHLLFYRNVCRALCRTDNCASYEQ
jgi:hypothetical protein